MNSIIRNLFLLISIAFLLKSCIIHDPKPEGCDVVTITVTEIAEGSSFDIVMKDSGSDYYYINRGLERGLTVEGLKEKILHKSVTLHLPKVGVIQTEHIAQLALNTNILYTEFSSVTPQRTK